MAIDNLKVLLIGYRDQSHSSAGGYDGITNMPMADVLLGEDVPFGFIPVSRRGKFLNIFFLKIISRFKRNKYNVMHYFYGEMLPVFSKSDKHKIVATIHNKVNPQNHKYIKALCAADGVITLSSSQAKELRSQFGINSVFIPHGFRKPQFNYISPNLDNNVVNVVVSGRNYRNIDELIASVDYCEKNHCNVFFHLLGQPKDVKEKLKDSSKAKCYGRLDDDHYFSLMASCDYNYLPLTFATANNALLEASFLGVKSILPRIDGITDYAAPEPLNIYYDNFDDLSKIWVSIDKSERSDAIVDYSSRFLWENIYPMVKDFYESLF